MSGGQREATVWSAHLVARCGGLPRTQAAARGQVASPGRRLIPGGDLWKQNTHRFVTRTLTGRVPCACGGDGGA